MPRCGVEMRRGWPGEHPKDCPGQVMAPDHYTGICTMNGKPYRVHWVCTQMESHRETEEV